MTTFVECEKRYNQGFVKNMMLNKKLGWKFGMKFNERRLTKVHDKFNVYNALLWNEWDMDSSFWGNVTWWMLTYFDKGMPHPWH
jgi:hypothetical protein